LLLGMGYLFVLLTVVLWPANVPVLVTLVTIPAALQITRLVGTPEVTPSQLNVAVRQTAALHFRYGLLFAAGLVFRAIIEQF
ncbi:MAG TPA: hypothetical protein PK819_10245, partial [Thermomicrobiales bacterium]|nr:hypothetical protein [Thermomicrobiales bacterium]